MGFVYFNAQNKIWKKLSLILDEERQKPNTAAFCKL